MPKNLFIIILINISSVFGQEKKIDSVNYENIIKRLEALEEQVLKKQKEDELKKLVQEADQLTTK